MATYILNKKLTDSETAVIFWQIFGGEKDFKRLYMAASGMTEKEAEENPLLLTQYTSRWKASQKYKKEVMRVKLLYDRFVKEIQEQAYNEGRIAAKKEIEGHYDEDAPDVPSGTIDYTDPKKQKEKLNEIINTAKDSGEALDALKVIISGQKQDAEAAKNNKVQRFYTPLQCRDCPLYQKEKAGLDE